jgi:hypothetical protein
MRTENSYYRRYTEKRAQRDKERSEGWKSKLKDPIAIFTGILAFGTVALAVIAVFQWCTLEKTDKTLRAGQRAFVFVNQSPGQWIEPTTIDNEIVQRWHIEWENSGNSQTKDLTLELYCARPSEKPIRDPISAYGKPTVTSERLLGPKQIQWGGVCNYKASELKQVQGGRHLYIGARATYWDIFDEPHLTEYCTEVFDLTGTVDKLDMRPDNRLRSCETRNCADKECEKKTK